MQRNRETYTRDTQKRDKLFFIWNKKSQKVHFWVFNIQEYYLKKKPILPYLPNLEETGLTFPYQRITAPE